MAPNEGDGPQGHTIAHSKALEKPDSMEATPESIGRGLLDLRSIFKIKQQQQQANPNKLLQPLLQAIRQADPTLKVFSYDTKEDIDVAAPFSFSEAEFNKHFRVIPPTAGSNTTTIVFRCSLSKRLQLLKHNGSNGLMEFLQQQRVSLLTDNFQGERISKIGQIFNIHPNHQHRESYKECIREALKHTKGLPEILQNLLTTEDAARAFPTHSESENSNDPSGKNTTISTENSDNEGFMEIESKATKKQRKTLQMEDFNFAQPELIKFPHFELAKTILPYGPSKNRHVTEILEISCASKDKNLVTVLFESIAMADIKAMDTCPGGAPPGTLPGNGVFLPYGSIQTESEKASYQNVILNHVSLLNDQRIIYVKGISPTALSHVEDYTNTQEPCTLEQAITNEPFVTWLTRTATTTSEGRIGIFTTKGHVQELRNFVDTTIRNQFQPGQPLHHLCMRDNQGDQILPFRPDRHIQINNSHYTGPLLKTYQTAPTPRNHRTWSSVARAKPMQMVYTEPARPVSKKSRASGSTQDTASSPTSTLSNTGKATSDNLAQLREQLAKSISENETKIANLTADLVNVSNNVNSLTQNMTDLKDTVATLTDKVDKLCTAFQQFQDHVNNTPATMTPHYPVPAPAPMAPAPMFHQPYPQPPFMTPPHQAYYPDPNSPTHHEPQYPPQGPPITSNQATAHPPDDTSLGSASHQ